MRPIIFHFSFQGIVSLCLLFESLLQKCEPQLFYHLKSSGIQPWVLTRLTSVLQTDLSIDFYSIPLILRAKYQYLHISVWKSPSSGWSEHFRATSRVNKSCCCGTESLHTTLWKYYQVCQLINSCYPYIARLCLFCLVNLQFAFIFKNWPFPEM